jgi:NADH-quinone oxidoreductase subunit C
MSEALQELSSYIGEAAGGLVASSDIAYGELTLKTDGARILDVF